MSTVSKSYCTLCSKLGLRPFTRENVFSYYIPLTSLASYGTLSVDIINPSLTMRIIPRYVTNVLLINTIIGTSFYIYTRPHLKSITNGKRIAYSALGSILFGMGSVLCWALAKSAIPRNLTLATVLGVGVSGIIVKIGTDYFDDCDRLIVKKN